MKYPPIHYHEYLDLNTLLKAQKRRSEEFGKPAHDEWLFITVHQTYELWFKQILFELHQVTGLMASNPISEEKIGKVNHHLSRIHGILKLSLGHIDILETMTPLDFLDFRDFLYPASGFQSYQFRLIEVMLGLPTEQRTLYNQIPFYEHLPQNHKDEVKKALEQKSLFDLVETWLERTPLLQTSSFNFWDEYKKAIDEMLSSELRVIQKNTFLNEEMKKRNQMMIEGVKTTFSSLFDEKLYGEYQSQGVFRLSLSALKAALFVQLYRDEPLLQQPHQLLTHLIDLDEVLTTWRYRHAQMVHRMLGRKIGTGGSSGHDYLKETAVKHKIFKDFTQLATFLIPRSTVPKLPDELKEKMNYRVFANSRTS